MFDSLTELIKAHLNFNNNLNNLSFIKIVFGNSENPLEYNRKEKSLVIDRKGLTEEKEIETVDKLGKSAFENQDFVIITQDQEKYNSVKKSINEPKIKSLLKFFRDKIPSEDYNTLVSAIYIKNRAESNAGFDEIYHLKGEVGKKYGIRGLNICNLYASGYFEKMIKPIWEEVEQQNISKQNFIDRYNLIIKEEAFAVFVSGNMSTENIKIAIENKINKNIRYGERAVGVHGIGKENINNIRNAILNIENDKKINIINKNIEESRNVISVKLSF